MSATGPAEAASFPFPIRLLYERPDERLRVVVDTAPAAVDDIDVEVGTERVRLAIDGERERHERTITALPPHRVFDGHDRVAVYNNGVLEVALETIPRWRAPRVR